MAARKAKADGVAKTERTSTTRGKTFQEVTADETSGAGEEAPEVSSGGDSKGYYGATPDPTPNENYTIAGVLAGKPVPETDNN